MLLRDYQNELLEKTVAAFKAGYRAPLIVAPCGAGKSYLFVAMIKACKGDVLILTHRQELKEQHEKLLSEMGVTNARVAMVLTEKNHLGEVVAPKMVISDEAHLSRSRSWVSCVKYYTKLGSFAVGLTATPVRLDGKPLGDIYDVLIQGVDTRWLIDHHRLSPYRYYAPTLIDTTGMRTIAGDYVVSDLEQFINERAVYGDIVKSYLRFAPGQRAIAYTVSIGEAIRTADAFNSAGIKAEAVSSNTPIRKRAAIMDDFRNGRITVLCNVGIISEGISIDEVSCCILMRPTESIALGIQQMMRCMRYLPDKVATIIDCVGNYTRVGLPDDVRDWSLTAPVKKRPLTDREGNFPLRCCPQCYMTFPTAPICPFCGAEYPMHPREIAAHQEIELQRITQEENEKIQAVRKRARMEQGRATTFEELVRLGQSRGYKNPAYWAAKVLRSRH